MAGTIGLGKLQPNEMIVHVKPRGGATLDDREGGAVALWRQRFVTTSWLCGGDLWSSRREPRSSGFQGNSRFRGRVGEGLHAPRELTPFVGALLVG
jgi:hypothetical protein